jgi:hypothetical protein
MSWSFTIGRIAGTLIRVHVTFVLFLIWIFAANYVSGGPEAAWHALVFMLLLLNVAHRSLNHGRSSLVLAPTPHLCSLPAHRAGVHL